MPPSRPPPLVVIVVGDAALRASLEFNLEVEGFRIDACASGEALLAMDLPPSDACLVVDERLPGVSGLGAIARLRAAGVRLPAILLTSRPSARLRTEALAAQAHLLDKPLVGDLLPLQVRAALTAARGEPGAG
ncbi:MAG: response regulator [Caulobacterales bacterium]|nr:response regulator [Caulobacterales bacterium]